MGFKYIGVSVRNLIDSAQDWNYWRAVLNATLNLLVPQAMGLVHITIVHGVAMLQWRMYGRILEAL